MAIKPNTSVIPPQDAVDISGLPPDALGEDSVAARAQSSRDNRKAGGDIPLTSPLAQKSDTRGYLHSLANALGVPINSEEFRQMAPTAIANMYLPGLGTAMNVGSGLTHSHSFQDVNRVLNPMAAPMEQLGSGNEGGEHWYNSNTWPGSLGSATPFLASMLAAPFIPGPKKSPEGVNLLKPRPQKAGPAKVPIYGEAPTAAAPGLVRRGLQAIAQEVLPGGLNRIAQAVLKKTTPAKPPVIGHINKPLAGKAAPSYTPPPEEFPMVPTTQAMPSEGPVSPPLNDPEAISLAQNWAQVNKNPMFQGQPPPEATAAYGDAPVQPIGASRPFNSPAPGSPLSEQSFAYLRGLMEQNRRNIMQQNRLKYTPNPGAGLNK